MAQDITVLNRQKSALKAKITRVDTFLASFQENEDSKTELTVKLDNVKDIQRSVDDLRNRYYQLPEETDLTETETSLEELDTRLENLEVSLKCLINNKCAMNINSELKSETRTQASVGIKLPEIPLPQFSGLYDEWSNFKEQFCNLIENNSQLTEMQKLYYLRAALKGEAKKLESSDDTYSSLFKALRDRYENKRLIVDTHIQSLLNHPKITHESATELRNLIDTVNKNIRALTVLEFVRNNFSDALLINIIFQKLDRETRKQFEITIASNEVPKLDDFLSYLEKRSHILEGLNRNTSAYKSTSNQGNRSKSFIVKTNSVINSCILCNYPHKIYNCKMFLNMTVPKRYELIKAHNYCLNCLNSDSLHKASQCRSKFVCSRCSRKHHSLLHRDNPNNTAPNYVATNEQQKQKESAEIQKWERVPPLPPSLNKEFATIADRSASEGVSLTNSVQDVYQHEYILLSTAVVFIKDSKGNEKRYRAILDSASQKHFCTLECANQLGLKKEKIHAPISGLNGNVLNVKTKIKGVISNSKGDFRETLDLLIVPKITDVTPSKYLDVRHVRLPPNMPLADPEFFKPAKIDLLLGVQLFYELLRDGKFRIDDKILLQETVFGYIVSGAIHHITEKQFCHLSLEMEALDETLKKFWEIETVEEREKILSDEELYCEEHFLRTHKRNFDGSYEVQMPMIEEGSQLIGKSKEIAEKRLNSIWRRLEQEPDMKLLYVEFLKEYEKLHHMEEVKTESNSKVSYYLPHHGVHKPEKKSTKLRVVFDASAKTTSGFSLNDVLLKGGNIQEDLYAIMLRFRKHKYAFTADIEKMYRQIWIHASQRPLQRILWKNGLDAPVKIYDLKTVTYGTKSAPYLATRVLHQLAHDEEANFPLAASVLVSDFYMDDVLSGASELTQAKELQSQLIDLLERGGMKLHKWSANDSQLLNEIPTADREYIFDDTMSTDVKVVKTLGMYWEPKLDVFSYRVAANPEHILTKRSVLSTIARIFDPLGLLGPIISKAKIFMQGLWLLKIDWHNHLPETNAKEWYNFLSTLPMVEDLKVPRLCLCKNPARIILHGFSDASQAAYGAVIYVQSTSGSATTCHPLCSKSRVAPTKTVTVPRLELCACVLLAKLMQRTLSALRLDVDGIRLWSDSTISLAWIKKEPQQLKTFVANRVTVIQQLTKDYEWGHVSSKDNPADLLSRGLNPKELISNQLWWHGPSFLDVMDSNPNSSISVSKEEETEPYLREIKTLEETTLVVTDQAANSNSVVTSDWITSIVDRSSRYMKLIRVFSFLFRFVHNCRNPHNKLSGSLSTDEVNQAEIYLLSQVQRGEFKNDISAIRKASPVSSKSKLRSLNPFLDKNGILRVGGRLDQSNLSYDSKFPVILPARHKLTVLIMRYYHLKNLHVGPQALLNCVRQKFWPISGRNLARKIFHDCITCFRQRPVVAEQLMGSLPPERVVPGSVFNKSGVDFCGPFLIKYKNQRKGIFQKVYVAIFVCLATKAIHFEIVTDLTSAAFIAALKRFFARRGKSACLFTDNATNFVGARSELKRLQTLVEKPNENLANYLSSEGITWKVIPPRAPNFGGLWEAGVKSFKYHLKRTIGNAKLTFEEFLTVVMQIEGVLNSRPIMPLSMDANDFSALTPGHFLIGRPITAPVEPNLTDVIDNRLSIWQRICKATQIIWKRWQRDYLSHLHQRSKWQFDKGNVERGTLVLLKEDNLPPCQWAMGRIESLIFGHDGRVRVVLVKTQTGIFKRSISKICILPVT